jgi:hypothetical protein
MPKIAQALEQKVKRNQFFEIFKSNELLSPYLIFKSNFMDTKNNGLALLMPFSFCAYFLLAVSVSFSSVVPVVLPVVVAAVPVVVVVPP